MPCYKPLKAWRDASSRGITFNPSKAYIDQPVQIPCGQCLSCRREKARQWAIRCDKEMKQHQDNCFITLTFDDQRVKDPLSLVTLQKRDFVNFMKRLRKNTGVKGIKFFHCGEYGEKHSRPHHHAILFGYDFPDKKPIQDSKLGHKQFDSEILLKAWQNQGDVTVSEANFATAQYIAKYCTKVWTESKASPRTQDQIYNGVLPEYISMSRGGRNGKGIGYGFYEDYKEETYRDDNVVINGQKMKPPKYFDSLYKEENPKHLAKIKQHRQQLAEGHEEYGDWDRLKEKEEYHELSTAHHTRYL